MIVRSVVHRPELDQRIVGNPGPLDAAIPLRPLGDEFERYAKPIARSLDKLTGLLPKLFHTHLDGCSACSQRRMLLNIAVPNFLSWKHGWKGSFRRAAAAFQSLYLRPNIIRR